DQVSILAKDKGFGHENALKRSVQGSLRHNIPEGLCRNILQQRNKASRVQIPENNLDNLKSTREEEDGTYEALDPQDWYILEVFMTGESGTPTDGGVGGRKILLFFVLPEGCDLLALVELFTPVEVNIALLESGVLLEPTFCLVLLCYVTGLANLTSLFLFNDVTAISNALSKGCLAMACLTIPRRISACSLVVLR
ncbi:hypothetical protein Tco_1225193, partial [Tanacetum coccineum]